MSRRLSKTRLQLGGAAIQVGDDSGEGEDRKNSGTSEQACSRAFSVTSTSESPTSLLTTRKYFPSFFNIFGSIGLGDDLIFTRLRTLPHCSLYYIHHHSPSTCCLERNIPSIFCTHVAIDADCAFRQEIMTGHSSPSWIKIIEISPIYICTPLDPSPSPILNFRQNKEICRRAAPWSPHTWAIS